MPLLTWDDKFSVDVQSIDKQHQKLFAMLNELYDAMTQGKGSQLAPAILERLIDYTQEHFAAEEALMKQARYPDFASHKAEHEKLKAEIAKIMTDAEGPGGRSVLGIPLLNFLRTWLQTHIAHRDKAYTCHLRAAGIH